MARFANLLLFGDQAVDAHGSVQGLYRCAKRSLFLSSFLRSTTDAVRAAVARLGPEDRRRFGTFDTLLDLSEAHSHSENDLKDAAVSTVVLCVAQLGWLLVRVESDPSILIDNASAQNIMLGLCTGSLPAVAAASTTCLSELLRLAPEIVCLSLRLGLEVSRRSRRLEDVTGSWATVLSDVSVDRVRAALQHFHDVQQMPPHRQAYISAVYPHSVTVSGSPSTLEAFFAASTELSEVRKAKLPIGAAYHARHLDMPDLDTIIGASPIFDTKIPSNTCIISTSSGEAIRGAHVRDLLRQVLFDILQLPLAWPAVMNKVISISTEDKIVLSPIGPTSAAKLLQNGLDRATARVIADEAVSHDISSNPGGSQAIAIIGMAGRFPGAVTLEEFWNVLENGLDLHKEVPADRFDVASHCDPTGKTKNSTLTPYGCFIDRPDLFDARLFKMSPREARQTDPMQRLILMTTYEALEMAGYGHDRTPASNHRRIGTFFGQTSDDWREVNASQDIDSFLITGGNRAFGPGRVNYHFGWEGPSLSIDTACSSSAAAIQLACSALLSRECDMAVAGGANILTASDIFAGLSRARFLSLTGSCKTFDHEADGYCRADGVATVILKRLEDAVVDRDNIQAVIRSAVTNHSAEAISITHPHVESQQRLFRRVLQEACVAPEKIEYVEVHGTGTQAGDVLESRSVTNVFARDRSRDNPLFIGTVKPNVGHGEAASGVTSVIKAVMMLRKSIIPPHVGIKTRMNENLPPFAALNTHIAKVKTPFNAHPSGDGKRRIVLNNFSAAGGNTSMLLEDPPKPTVQGQDPRSAHVVTISARTPKALRQNIERLSSYLETNKHAQLSNLSYTTTARRMHHVFRKAYSATNVTELAVNMTKDLANFNEPERINKAPSVAFVFTGQGSQYPGMGKGLFETSSAFRESILTSEAISRKHGFPSFLELITNPELDFKNCSPVQTQLGFVALEIALAILWQSWGIRPDVVVGHSLGEYPALCVSGILSITDMIYLVGKRAELIQEKCTPESHAMLAVESSREQLQQSLSDLDLASCEVACINSQDATVLSGNAKDIRRLRAHLEEGDVKANMLQVPYAFHSAQMDPILHEYEASARTVYFGKPTIPLASTLLGTLITEQGVVDAHYLARQARDPVKFRDAIEDCRDQEIIDNRTTWFEIGPRPVCLSMVRSILQTPRPRLFASMQRKEQNWLTLCKSIATAYDSGLDFLWGDFHREYEEALSLLELPSYAFDLERYWIQYEGDWTIRKGDTRSATSSPSPFSTTVLQSIESARFEEDARSVVFTSNLADPRLREVVLGHVVNGSSLCPASLYAAMALTASSYIHTQMEPTLKVPAMDVCNMEMSQPLIVNPGEATQMVRVTAVKSLQSASVQISVSSQDGDQLKTYAQCSVRYGDGDGWASEWARNASLIKTRIASLRASANVGRVHRLFKNVVYKLFSSLVKYDKHYRAIEEVFMDSDLLEAAATVKLSSNHADRKFPYNPYWIDSIAHLSGFVLNESDTKDENIACIAHGWESMRIAGPLSEDKSYLSYVRMQPTGARGFITGDIHVLDDDKIVAVFTGVKFREIKRTILDSLLPRNSARPHLQPPNSAAPVVPVGTFAPSSSRPSFSQILACISFEIGVAPSELVDDARFVDLGVDSLLTISILERLREQTLLDLPSSLFTSYSTVRELKKYFHERFQIKQDITLSDSSSHGISPHDDSVLPRSLVPATSTVVAGMADAEDTFRSVIAAEIGVDVKEIQPAIPLADLGVDSLLSLSIMSAINQVTGLSLPSSFLHHHPTFGSIQRFLNKSALSIPGPAELKAPPKSVLRSTSVLLQGDPSPSAPSLFLLPDGSGSASSYVNLPPFDLDVAVFGLNSPFRASPSEHNLPLSTVAQIYVSEILRRRPHGPYLLGGWSIGGIYAYEVCKQLIASGEVVTDLILIDAPCPNILAPLPIETVDVLERIGMFDGIKRENKGSLDGVRQHFLGSISALEQYTPSPLDPSRPAPRCLAVWAREGVWEFVVDEEGLRERREMNHKTQDWLMDPRQSFGPNGWETLLPRVECAVVDGNHFTVMRRPQVEALGRVIATALETFLREA